MGTIVFAGKIQKQTDPNSKITHEYVRIPVIARQHIVINSFRNHPKYGFYANSTVLFSMIEKDLESMFPDHWIRLNDLPPNVSVTHNGFIAEVSITI